MKTKNKPLPMGVQMLGHFADRIAEARITPKMLAAEEMYEALKNIVASHDKRGSVGYGLIEAGAIALAKAEGRQ